MNASSCCLILWWWEVLHVLHSSHCNAVAYLEGVESPHLLKGVMIRAVSLQDVAAQLRLCVQQCGQGEGCCHGPGDPARGHPFQTLFKHKPEHICIL